MQRYKVIHQPVTLFAGILDLSTEQAAPRLQSLDDLGSGLYQIRHGQSVSFKCGEAFGYDGAVNKALLQQITPVPAVSEDDAQTAAAASQPPPPEEKTWGLFGRKKK